MRFWFILLGSLLMASSALHAGELSFKVSDWKHIQAAPIVVVQSQSNGKYFTDSVGPGEDKTSIAFDGDHVEIVTVIFSLTDAGGNHHYSVKAFTHPEHFKGQDGTIDLAKLLHH